MPFYGDSGFGFGPYGYGESGPVGSLPLAYYLDLLTSEYQNSSIFLGWLQSVLQPLDDLTNVLSTFTSAFDLSNAIGAQLDVLGLIIGQSRTVAFQPSNNVSPVLDDDTYRLLLQARIAQNAWDGRMDSLQSIWKSLFSDGTITIADQQNMSAIIFVSASFSSIIQDLIVQGYIVPRPETVEYTYEVGDLPLFGADLNNAYIAGADIGHAS